MKIKRYSTKSPEAVLLCTKDKDGNIIIKALKDGFINMIISGNTINQAVKEGEIITLKELHEIA
jgi:hypothetical protein